MPFATLDCRVALARLEAALIQHGFADHDDVAIRIAPDENPSDVLAAMSQHCTLSALDGEQLSNVVGLRKFYKSESEYTHVVAPGIMIDVPGAVTSLMHRLKELLPHDEVEYARSQGIEKKVTLKSAEVGWVLSIDKSHPDTQSVVLRIVTTKGTKRSLNLEADAKSIADTLHVPVRLEVGMNSVTHADRWAHLVHYTARPGLSIGKSTDPSDTAGSTITIPVRLRKADAMEEPSRPRYHFITAGHALHEGRSRSLSKVRQPSRNTNSDRVIGQVEAIEYSPQYGAWNFFDVALVSSSTVPALQFGRGERYQIEGIWSEEIGSNQRTFMYGASSGLVPIKVLSYGDVIVTMLSLEGARLVYRDMIEFSRDDDDSRPASQGGDSGGPILVRVGGDRFRVAGLVVGGGTRIGQSRRPRSFAVPIKRVLDQLDVRLW